MAERLLPALLVLWSCGLAAAEVRISAGYWAPAAEAGGVVDTQAVLHCIEPGVCPGGAPSTCAGGRAGPACSSCLDEEEEPGAFGGVCKECRALLGAGLVPAFAFLLFLALVPLPWAALYMPSPEPSSIEAEDSYEGEAAAGRSDAGSAGCGLTRRGHIAVAIHIVLHAVQRVALAVDASRSMRPDMFQGQADLQAFLALMLFDARALRPGCIKRACGGVAEPYDGLAFSWALPVIWLVSVALTGLAVRGAAWLRRRSKDDRSAAMGAWVPPAPPRHRCGGAIAASIAAVHRPVRLVVEEGLRIFAYLFLLPLVKLSLRAFQCRIHPGGRHSFAEDPGLECGLARLTLLPFAILVVLLYCVAPVCWLVAFSLRRLRKRKASQEFDQDLDEDWFSTTSEFPVAPRATLLLQQFQPTSQWWALVIVLRNVTCAALSCLPSPPHAVLALAWAEVVHGVAVCRAWPWTSPALCRLDGGLAVIVLLVCFVAIGEEITPCARVYPLFWDIGSAPPQECHDNSMAMLAIVPAMAALVVLALWQVAVTQKAATGASRPGGRYPGGFGREGYAEDLAEQIGLGTDLMQTALRVASSEHRAYRAVVESIPCDRRAQVRSSLLLIREGFMCVAQDQTVLEQQRWAALETLATAWLQRFFLEDAVDPGADDDDDGFKKRESVDSQDLDGLECLLDTQASTSSSRGDVVSDDGSSAESASARAPRPSSSASQSSIVSMRDLLGWTKRPSVAQDLAAQAAQATQAPQAPCKRLSKDSKMSRSTSDPKSRRGSKVSDDGEETQGKRSRRSSRVSRVSRRLSQAARRSTVLSGTPRPAAETGQIGDRPRLSMYSATMDKRSSADEVDDSDRHVCFDDSPSLVEFAQAALRLSDISNKDDISDKPDAARASSPILKEADQEYRDLQIELERSMSLCSSGSQYSDRMSRGTQGTQDDTKSQTSRADSKARSSSSRQDSDIVAAASGLFATGDSGASVPSEVADLLDDAFNMASRVGSHESFNFEKAAQLVATCSTCGTSNDEAELSEAAASCLAGDAPKDDDEAAMADAIANCSTVYTSKDEVVEEWATESSSRWTDEVAKDEAMRKWKERKARKLQARSENTGLNYRQFLLGQFGVGSEERRLASTGPVSAPAGPAQVGSGEASGADDEAQPTPAFEVEGSEDGEPHSPLPKSQPFNEKEQQKRNREDSKTLFKRYGQRDAERLQAAKDGTPPPCSFAEWQHKLNQKGRPAKSGNPTDGGLHDSGQDASPGLPHVHPGRSGVTCAGASKADQPPCGSASSATQSTNSPASASSLMSPSFGMPLVCAEPLATPQGSEEEGRGALGADGAGDSMMAPVGSEAHKSEASEYGMPMPVRQRGPDGPADSSKHLWSKVRGAVLTMSAVWPRMRSRGTALEEDTHGDMLPVASTSTHGTTVSGGSASSFQALFRFQWMMTERGFLPPLLEAPDRRDSSSSAAASTEGAGTTGTALSSRRSSLSRSPVGHASGSLCGSQDSLEPPSTSQKLKALFGFSAAQGSNSCASGTRTDGGTLSTLPTRRQSESAVQQAALGAVGSSPVGGAGAAASAAPAGDVAKARPRSQSGSSEQSLGLGAFGRGGGNSASSTKAEPKPVQKPKLERGNSNLSLMSIPQGDWLLPQNSMLRVVTSQAYHGDAGLGEGSNLPQETAMAQRERRTAPQEKEGEKDKPTKDLSPPGSWSSSSYTSSTGPSCGGRQVQRFDVRSIDSASSRRSQDSSWSVTTSQMLESQFHDMAKDADHNGSLEDLLQSFQSKNPVATTQKVVDVCACGNSNFAPEARFCHICGAPRPAPVPSLRRQDDEEPSNGDPQDVTVPRSPDSSSASEQASGPRPDDDEAMKRWKARREQKKEAREKKRKTQAAATADWKNSFRSGISQEHSSGVSISSDRFRYVSGDSHGSGAGTKTASEATSTSDRSALTERSVALRGPEGVSMRSPSFHALELEDDTLTPKRRLWK